jgi:hypothetical protein
MEYNNTNSVSNTNGNQYDLLSSEPRTRMYQIILIVVLVVLVVGILIVVVLGFTLHPTAKKGSGNPLNFLFSVQPCQAVSSGQCIATPNSTWAFGFSGANAIELQPDNTLTIAPGTWNTNPMQRFSCVSVQNATAFGRGTFVLQNLGNSARAICDDNGTPSSCLIDTGDPRQIFTMIRISPNGNTPQAQYAFINQNNNKVLSQDPVSGGLIFADQSNSSVNNLISAQLVPLFGTVVADSLLPVVAPPPLTSSSFHFII